METKVGIILKKLSLGNFMEHNLWDIEWALGEQGVGNINCYLKILIILVLIKFVDYLLVTINN